MSHKADSSFFHRKRFWSVRKDRILGEYLSAYLPKIATQRRPVLIVDAFAGPGKFGDGSPGSPLIICHAIAKARAPLLKAKVLCIEKEPELYGDLSQLMAQFPFATASQGSFTEHIMAIEQVARDHSVFLYVDPFSVDGLDWDGMATVFNHITRSQTSVEILLNFNAPSFVRRALGALGRKSADPDPAAEDLEEIDVAVPTMPTVERLNGIVGGNWWQDTIQATSDFPTQVHTLTLGMVAQLRRWFNEVCFHELRALPNHNVPKYALIFGSRHPDALILMNDAMIKSRQALAALASPGPTLFEIRSEQLVPDTARIPSLVERHCRMPKSRRAVILGVIRDAFCEFSYSEIRGCIESMLRAGRLRSSTGKARINDTVVISLPSA